MKNIMKERMFGVRKPPPSLKHNTHCVTFPSSQLWSIKLRVLPVRLQQFNKARKNGKLFSLLTTRLVNLTQNKEGG